MRFGALAGGDGRPDHRRRRRIQGVEVELGGPASAQGREGRQLTAGDHRLHHPPVGAVHPDHHHRPGPGGRGRRRGSAAEGNGVLRLIFESDELGFDRSAAALGERPVHRDRVWQQDQRLGGRRAQRHQPGPVGVPVHHLHLHADGGLRGRGEADVHRGDELGSAELGATHQPQDLVLDGVGREGLGRPLGPRRLGGGLGGLDGLSRAPQAEGEAEAERDPAQPAEGGGVQVGRQGEAELGEHHREGRAEPGGQRRGEAGAAPGQQLLHRVEHADPAEQHQLHHDAGAFRAVSGGRQANGGAQREHPGERGAEPGGQHPTHRLQGPAAAALRQREAEQAHPQGQRQGVEAAHRRRGAGIKADPDQQQVAEIDRGHGIVVPEVDVPTPAEGQKPHRAPQADVEPLQPARADEGQQRGHHRAPHRWADDRLQGARGAVEPEAALEADASAQVLGQIQGVQVERTEGRRAQRPGRPHQGHRGEQQRADGELTEHSDHGALAGGGSALAPAGAVGKGMS